MCESAASDERRLTRGPSLRAVLFDAVGTLIRPYPSVGAVYAGAARAHGVSCSPAPLNLHFRPAYRELSPERFAGGDSFRTSEGRERRWWLKVVGLTFQRAGCAPLPPAARKAAFDAFARGEAWRPYGDALPALERLSALGLRLGVVSNFDSRLRRVLDELGLAPYFSTLAISSEAGRAKPSPAIFRGALKELGVGAEEALHVGDRFREDYQGARDAGLSALLLVRRAGRRGPGEIGSLNSIVARLGPA